MIEINLLPEELRKSDGTPPARLLVIFLSVGLLCATGFMVVQYHFVSIPGKLDEKRNLETDIAQLKIQEALVQAKKSSIQTLDTKIKALTDLSNSRVRYGKMMDLIWDAVPEGVWFRSFKVVADTSGATVGAPGAKAYSIELLGYATGDKDSDRTNKLVELVSGLRQKLEIKDKPRTGDTVPAKYGVCSQLDNVSFVHIEVPDSKLVDTLPEPTEIDAKAKETLKPPKQALDFTMSIKFQMYQQAAAN
jgi:Tfp pilus assembly protein PilN